MIPTLVSMAITISHTRMTMSIQLNFFFSIMFASPPCPSPKGEGSEMLFKGLIICLTPDGGIYSPRPLERGQGVRLLERRCTTDGCLLCLSGTPSPSGEGWGEAFFRSSTVGLQPGCTSCYLEHVVLVAVIVAGVGTRARAGVGTATRAAVGTAAGVRAATRV